MRNYPLAWIYTRLSSAKSGESSHQTQEAHCRRYWENVKQYHNGVEIGGVFGDHGTSAFRFPFFERDGAQKLIHNMQVGDYIICHRNDRMFRTMKDQSYTLSTLRDCNIHVHFQDVTWENNESDANWIIDQVRSLTAEYEARMASARTREDKAERRRNGEVHSRHAPPGWLIQRHPNGKKYYAPNKYQIAVGIKMLKFYDECGMPIDRMSVYNGTKKMGCVLKKDNGKKAGRSKVTRFVAAAQRFFPGPVGEIRQDIVDMYEGYKPKRPLIPISKSEYAIWGSELTVAQERKLAKLKVNDPQSLVLALAEQMQDHASRAQQAADQILAIARSSQ